MLTPEEMIQIEKKRQEFFRNYEAKDPKYKKRMEEERKYREAQWAQGKIIDPTINKWLEGEIAAARNALIIGMLLTALIKGQIFIWLIMYIAYKGRVEKAKRDAMESDRKRYDYQNRGGKSSEPKNIYR